MKPALKYLPVAALAAALTWFSIDVRSDDPPGEKLKSDENAENPEAREAYRRLSLQDENGEIPADGLRNALEQKHAMQFLPEAWAEFLQGNAPNLLTPWVSIGPGNIGGRIRSLIIHPNNPDIMWVGGVAGGVWKTTNGGASWSTNTDYLANLAVNCMVMDPANPDVLYAGTGEGFFSGDVIRGDGIFKTEDGGNNWVQLPNSRIFQWVNRLAISPTNSKIMLAATQYGLYRSDNAGEDWSLTTLTMAGILDVHFKPVNGGSNIPGCIAGTRGGGAFYSFNDGGTWTAATGLPTPTPGQVIPGRVELAYSHSNPSIVYASIEAFEGQLYRSTDGGQSFTYTGSAPASTSGEESSWYNNALWETESPSASNFATGASWYNNALWVDPTNPNRLLVGAGSMSRTTQGGAGGWSGSAHIHADNHVIVHHPDFDGDFNRQVFAGNDGGIYWTNDAVGTTPIVWTSLNHHLGITQFYGAAGHVATGRIIGGAQDNGTIQFNGDPENWSTLYGGDGGYCAVDQTTDPYFYGEYIFLQIFRVVNGVAQCIDSGIGDAPPTHDCNQLSGGNADFIAPFVLDPNDPNRILAGGKSLWRSNNVRTPNPAQVSWTAIKQPIASQRTISAIAVAPGNSDFIWVGYDDGSVYFTTNGTASTPTWSQRDDGLPGRRVTRLTIGNATQVNASTTDPEEGMTTYATFGGYKSDTVWKTQDNGVFWEPIHNNLPYAPVHSLVISPSNSNTLYVGTEVGVFASADAGEHWSPSIGEPNAPVFELFWMGPKLVSATHGRGIFTIVPPSP